MIFIDTGAFVARDLRLDQYHARALSSWERLAKASIPFFTSSYVLVETFTMLARRGGYAFAADRARSILDSSEIQIWRPSEDIDREALDLFDKYADQQISYTDCISFVLMKRHRIKQAFSYDAHFERAGFTLWK